MKYILINDFHYIIKEKYRPILTYLLIFILYFYLGKNTYPEEYFYELLNNIFGFKVHLIEDLKNILNLSFILLNYSLYIYLSIIIFINDLNNFDNLSLRISFNKWLTTKVIVQFLVCLIINTIIFLIILPSGSINSNIYIILIKKCLIVTIISIFTYIIMFLKSKNRSISYLLLISSFLVCFVSIDIETISFNYILLTLIIFQLILTILSLHNKFSNLKE